MKKLKIFAVATVALALLFTGCENITNMFGGGESGGAKTVKVSEVTTVNGQKVKQENKIANKDDFEQILIPALMGSASSLANFSKIGSDADAFRAALKTVTVDELETAFDDLEKQFEAAGDSDTINIDWQGPTGKITLSGEYADYNQYLDANIEALSLKINAKNTTAGSTTETISGSASAKAAGSVAIKDFTASPIPSAKVNASVSANAKNIKAIGSDKDGLIDLSGSVAFTGGFDSAFLFIVEDAAGKKYNGVIKATTSVSVNQKLSKEKIEEYKKLSEEMEKRDPDYTKLDQYAKVKISIDVYDVNGKKLFTYFSADSVSELIKKIEDFGVEA